MQKTLRLNFFVYIILFFVSFLSNQLVAQDHVLAPTYSISSIPNPKEKGQDYFISNPNYILSSSTEQHLNEISVEIEKATSSEFAIVVVNDFNTDDDFQFALDLFNHWGIGKSENNNGLLLFIAKDRRKYRFITGYGMEATLPDAYLKHIGEKYLVPNFRNEDYDQGVLEAADIIRQVLLAPDSKAELEALFPEAIPFWSWKNKITQRSLLFVLVFGLCYFWLDILQRRFQGTKVYKSKYFPPLVSGCGCMLILMFFSVFIFAFVFKNIEEVYSWKNVPYFVLVLCSITLAMKYNSVKSIIENSNVDRLVMNKALIKFKYLSLIPLLLTPLAFIDFFSLNRKIRENKDRLTPPDDSGNWERIGREESNKAVREHLEYGQKVEEKIKSKEYEVWRNTLNGEKKIIGFNVSNSYSDCPSCHYRTFEKGISKILKEATYSSSGEKEVYDKCKNCSYTLSHGLFTIPKKVRSTSSSGGGSSSSGGSGRSSSSGGGSFGGGRSGGGGAGGSW